jgi:hypothetical protein
LFKLSVTVHLPFPAIGGFYKNTYITEIMKNAFQGFYTDRLTIYFRDREKNPQKVSKMGGILEGGIFRFGIPGCGKMKQRA